MFGSDPFGSVPFGAGGSAPFDYDAMLAESRTEFVVTVEMKVWDTSTADLIDRTTGTNIGNMTANGGLAAAFDGTTTQGAAASAARAANTGYVGKTLAAPAAIDRAVVHGTNNVGYAFSTNGATTVDLYGKVGTAPSSATNGTLIGSIAFTDTSNESVGREIDCTDKSTVYDHVWAVVTSPGEGTAVYCAEVVLYRNRLSTLYLATAEWATSPTDIPASTPFDGRLTTVLKFNRSIVGDRIGINHTASEGTIVFANLDGAYDAYIDGFAIDGREVIVRLGRKSDSFSNHLVIFRGVGVDWFGDDTVTITVKDRSDLLDVPASPNVYAGTGDAEGGDGLTGKRKPVVHGHATGVPPVSIDQTLLIYQVHDGAIGDVVSVFDRGAGLLWNGDDATYAALAAASISAGRYRTCFAEGFFRLGSTPAGFVFATVWRIGNYADLDWDGEATAAVLQDFVEAAGLTEAEIDMASLDSLAITQPAEIAHFLGPNDSMTVRAAADAIMAGVGGWCGFNRAGKLRVGILAAPTGDPVAYFKRDEGDIIDLSREKLPSGVWPPPWRWRVAHSQRFVQTDDFAGSVNAVIRQSYSQPYDLAVAEDASIKDDYRGAQEPSPVEALFSIEADAQDEADRLLALYSSGYRLYRMTLGRQAVTLDLGDEINVTWPRYGLDAGKNLVIVSIEDNIDLSDGGPGIHVEITAFG